MKIQQLLTNVPVMLSNEEKEFLHRYPQVKITSLDERHHWLAQNLVRKGLYSISKDNTTITKTK